MEGLFHTAPSKSPSLVLDAGLFLVSLHILGLLRMELLEVDRHIKLSVAEINVACAAPV